MVRNKAYGDVFQRSPREVRNIREGDINLKTGEILIPRPKEKRVKVIYLLPEDVEIFNQFLVVCQICFSLEGKTENNLVRNTFISGGKGLVTI